MLQKIQAGKAKHVLKVKLQDLPELLKTRSQPLAHSISFVSDMRCRGFAKHAARWIRIQGWQQGSYGRMFALSISRDWG